MDPAIEDSVSKSYPGAARLPTVEPVTSVPLDFINDPSVSLGAPVPTLLWGPTGGILGF